jgi:hypothetical protein
MPAGGNKRLILASGSVDLNRQAGNVNAQAPPEKKLEGGKIKPKSRDHGVAS